MPAKSRVFSELFAEDAAENGISATMFVFIAILLPSLTNKHASQPFVDAKRRKTTGLNSRLDRMVETMNATYRSPTKSDRHRSRSSGSSVSSYGVPRTPVDAYEGLQAGALGQDFSVIKMRNGMDADEEDTGSQNTRCTAPLPSWLSETFTTLTKKHPLRLLLPKSKRNESSIQISQDSEEIFAFKAPLKPPEADPAPALQSPIAFRAFHNSAELNLPDPCDPPSFQNQPFSTPGPASSICQPSPPRSFVSISPEFSLAQPHTNASHHQIDYLAPVEDNAALNFSLYPSASTPPIPNYDPIQCYRPNDARNVLPLPLNPPPTSFLPSCSPECYPDPDNDDWNHRSEMPNAFSTPGPAYMSSRPPIYYDNPTGDALSDSLDTPYEVDYTSLDFQWIPFARDISHFSESKVPIYPKPSVIEPSAIIDDLDSLPPSSDQPSGDDSNDSYVQVNKSSSDRELPLATSSDPALDHQVAHAKENNEEAFLRASLPELSSPDTGHGLTSPNPFRFIPPSRSSSKSVARTVVPIDQPSQLRRTLSSNRHHRMTSSRIPATKVPPQSSGYSVNMEAADLDVLKNNLLDTLDKIAPDPLIRQKRTSSTLDTVPVKSMIGSQDSIESWDGRHESLES
ncbi:hypothetical protein BDP27DRAFT_1446164 [Rhodocollybia butyracea]|uniref:Uncharacterized protein n=1 Tax=Rhodocollybia butyracea TaxID=206335 RepID=A0A9P5Q131_9AGAR|nr:hypothetical protein BDP27DRAFT_1446164 [Rhodocollybia butyracea]